MDAVGMGIFGLFALSNMAAIAFGRTSPDRTKRAIPWLQRSTTLQLAVLGWLQWGFSARHTALSGFNALLAAGLTISFGADLIMGELIRVRHRVLVGIAVFAAAHVAYIFAFRSLSLMLSRPAPVLGWWMGWSLAGLVLWKLFVDDPANPSALRAGALVYTLLLATMVAMTFAVGRVEPRLWMAPAGATLFLSSDLLLGNHIFRKNSWPFVKEVVWVLYAAGQAGLLLAALAAPKVCCRG